MNVALDTVSAGAETASSDMRSMNIRNRDSMISRFCHNTHNPSIVISCKMNHFYDVLWPVIQAIYASRDIVAIIMKCCRGNYCTLCAMCAGIDLGSTQPLTNHITTLICKPLFESYMTTGIPLCNKNNRNHQTDTQATNDIVV